MISPFVATGPVLDREKFRDPERTATGEPRAVVAPAGLTTLWFNTGTLCNLSCRTCYIESSPVNDALVYLGLDEVRGFLDEIAQARLPTRQIGFTGGEPFMNRNLPAMLELCLDRGFEVLVLTNAMRPMRRFETALLTLPHSDRLTFRISRARAGQLDPGTGRAGLAGKVRVRRRDRRTPAAGRDRGRGARRLCCAVCNARRRDRRRRSRRARAVP
jgi:hypothetical protein